MLLLLTYSVRNLLLRWKASVMAVFGITLVVAVFIALLSMAGGLLSAVRATGDTQNAMVVQQGAQSELSSLFPKIAGDRVAVDPRIARDAEGQPLVSPELVAIIALPGRADNVLTNVTVRGVTVEAFNVRNGIKVAGRLWRPGLFEVVVGKKVQQRFRGLEIGSRIAVMKGQFEVVGVLSANGSSFESEIWGDFDAIASVLNRTGLENSLTVRLTDAQAIPAFDAELQADPQFQLQMTGERQYYEDAAGPVVKVLRGLALFVSLVMGLGAVFGAMNTMYALVAARTREVGTLRALGFRRGDVVSTFVIEGIVLAFAGGIAGCILSLATDGLSASTTVNMGQMGFAFHVTWMDLSYGLFFAILMGFLGSILPAVRAARLPIVAALNES